MGHVAVCDADGRLLAAAGDPLRSVFARSSMKPLQAAVALRAIGEELPDDLVAVMCASHSGERVHVEAVRRLLARGGLDFSALRCPPMWPMDEHARARAARPRPELGDCSGKHAGMLLACVRSGWDTGTYLEPTHPLQRRVGRAVLRATGERSVVVGVDGCGVPVHGVPLAAMATLYARLARPERLGGLASQARRCVAAMRAEPYLVAGRDRPDTLLMQASAGVVAKSGAEGLACASVLEGGIGVALKVQDGAGRASGPGIVRALELLGALSPLELEALRSVARRPVTGGEEVVGEVVSDFALRRPRSSEIRGRAVAGATERAASRTIE